MYSPRKTLRGKLPVRYQGLTLRFAVNVDFLFLNNNSSLLKSFHEEFEGDGSRLRENFPLKRPFLIVTFGNCTDLSQPKRRHAVKGVADDVDIRSRGMLDRFK